MEIAAKLVLIGAVCALIVIFLVSYNNLQRRDFINTGPANQREYRTCLWGLGLGMDPGYSTPQQLCHAITKE